jgi:hypothetical protein
MRWSVFLLRSAGERRPDDWFRRCCLEEPASGPLCFAAFAAGIFVNCLVALIAFGLFSQIGPNNRRTARMGYLGLGVCGLHRPSQTVSGKERYIFGGMQALSSHNCRCNQ